MEHSSVRSLTEKLTALYQEDSRDPFPYQDCWKLISKFGEHYQDLAADLNVYFMDIAGYCSWGKKITTWPEEKINEVRMKQSKSFFDKYPQYKPLKAAISPAETPDLHLQMARYEEMRLTLRKALFYLLTERQSQNTLSEVDSQQIHVVQAA